MLHQKPRILLIPFYFSPLGSPRGIRWTNIAHYLVQKGSDVTVVATDPPENSQFWDASLQEIVEATGEGLRVLRIPIGARNASGTERLRWMWRALPRIRSLGESFDVVISSAMPIVCHFLGRWVKQTGRARSWIADYGDPWSTSQLRHGSALQKWVKRAVERQLLSSADAVTITTSQGLDAFTAVYPHEKRIHIIPQGASLFHLNHSWDEDTRQSGSAVRLLFTGGLDNYRPGADLLLTALRIVGKDYAKLTLIGLQSTDFKEQAKAYGVEEQVTVVTNYIPQAQIIEYQSHADMLVNFANIVPDHVAGKFYEYLATDKPILYITETPHDEPSQLIRKHAAGFVCTTADEIVDAINQVKAQITNTGAARRERVQGVGFDERAERYWQLIHAMLL